ncbi:MAG: 4-hydroxythreonine-4-phosphate dehydrogenase PdxA [Pseudomonadota bacterium]
MSQAPIVITTGEPAGIGPDISLMLASWRAPARLVLLGDRPLLEERARLLGVTVRFADYAPGRPAREGALEVLHVPLAEPCRAGRLSPKNSRYVLALLDRAIAGCMSGEFGAMVTAPVHKGVINDAGIPFTGHTEYLAENTATARVVMMLVGGGLRVALATTHVALKDVPAVLTAAELEAVIRILEQGLRTRLRIPKPRILVAGLNPHAGEGGYLGREEIEVMEPVLARLRGSGMDLVGPLPADTLFTPRRLQGADCALAMYHDQGLPVLKYASFGAGVNVTLGLPIVRTSVDHGTALELAGSGKADAGSLRAAVELAAQLAGTAA